MVPNLKKQTAQHLLSKIIEKFMLIKCKYMGKYGTLHPKNLKLKKKPQKIYNIFFILFKKNITGNNLVKNIPIKNLNPVIFQLLADLIILKYTEKI